MSNNSATWSDFNTAYVALLNHPEYEGLGFMLSDDIVCVDLDNKHDEMTESDFQKLLDDFLKNIPSYCEISHSGKGYHIFVKGKLPKGARRKNNVEIYNDFRYIAITGNIYKDYTEIIEEPEGLIKMYKKYLGEPVKAPKQKVIPQVIHMGNVDCQKVLERAKNDKKFMTLYKGNWKNLNYDSQSEADAAFASLLAFYAEKNLKVMDQIFRSSNLYREKYERKQSGSTYGNIILEQAASFVKEVYQERDSTLVNYASSVPAKKKYSEYTDTGNAQMFLEKYGNEVLYNFDNKIWNIWTGKKWEEDLKDTVKNKVEKVALEQLEKFGDVKEIKKNARKMLNTAGKNHTLLESQFKRAVINTDYDSYDYLINTQSGIYDLNKNILLDFDRKLKMSKITSCGIDQNPPLLWLKFINEIFQGNEELINYIQKAVGYTLTGSIKEQIV
ncbi:MAG: hypothetical protein PHH71_03820, partial [Clostridia bacterium]|nr:hypothetical protein [Clostridia bacterium]